MLHPSNDGITGENWHRGFNKQRLEPNRNVSDKISEPEQKTATKKTVESFSLSRLNIKMEVLYTLCSASVKLACQ
jgi:hypothetical protein